MIYFFGQFVEDDDRYRFFQRVLGPVLVVEFHEAAGIALLDKIVGRVGAIHYSAEDGVDECFL